MHMQTVPQFEFLMAGCVNVVENENYIPQQGATQIQCAYALQQAAHTAGGRAPPRSHNQAVAAPVKDLSVLVPKLKEKKIQRGYYIAFLSHFSLYQVNSIA